MQRDEALKLHFSVPIHEIFSQCCKYMRVLILVQHGIAINSNVAQFLRFPFLRKPLLRLPKTAMLIQPA